MLCQLATLVSCSPSQPKTDLVIVQPGSGKGEADFIQDDADCAAYVSHVSYADNIKKYGEDAVNKLGEEVAQNSNYFDCMQAKGNVIAPVGESGSAGNMDMPPLRPF